MLELVFLGTAASAPSIQRGLPSQVVLYQDERFIVDCGEGTQRQILRSGLGFRRLNRVLLTHGHLDHCGWLPRLIRGGFTGPVYCTPATGDITAIVLRDSAHIQAEDAAYKKRRHKKEGRKSPRPIEPLYTAQEVETTLGQIRRADYRETTEAAPGIGVAFHEAGHILGSTLLCLTLDHGAMLNEPLEIISSI